MEALDADFLDDQVIFWFAPDMSDRLGDREYRLIENQKGTLRDAWCVMAPFISHNGNSR